MSKQLSIATALARMTEEKERRRQARCRHKFVSVPVIDAANDKVYYFGYCPRCGKKTE